MESSPLWIIDRKQTYLIGRSLSESEFSVRGCRPSFGGELLVTLEDMLESSILSLPPTM